MMSNQANMGGPYVNITPLGGGSSNSNKKNYNT